MIPRFRPGLPALMLAAALACSAGTLVQTGRAEAGSLRIEDLPADQQSRIWARLDQLAFFESGARVCGRPTGLEQRLREAAVGCLSAETIDRITTAFRTRMKAATPTFDRDAYCGNAQMPAILTSFHQSTDDLVGKVAGMCKACLATGMCK